MPLLTLVRRAICPFVALVAVSPLVAHDYEVGPGRAYTSIGAVPWTQLQPGDRVFIHWRPEPYRETWVIPASGSAESPILIKGVRSANGQRPVIDAREAVTAPGQSYRNEEYGLLHIQRALGLPVPQWIVVSGLELRSARWPHRFYDADGIYRYWSEQGAAIALAEGAHVVISDCELYDSGFGVNVGPGAGATEEILIQKNVVHSNGWEGQSFAHNISVHAKNIQTQYNYVGPLRAGALGNGILDRSAGSIHRYNWIEGGRWAIDLVEPNRQELWEHPLYGDDAIYGNIIIWGPSNPAFAPIRYGGRGGMTEWFRQRRLLVFNNTFVLEGDGLVATVELPTPSQEADVRNNIFFTVGGGDRLRVLKGDGFVDLQSNFARPGWQALWPGADGLVSGSATMLEGSGPGFVDLEAKDLRLVSAASTRNEGVGLPSFREETNLNRHYARSASWGNRRSDQQLDLGAYEYGAVLEVLFSADFEQIGEWDQH